MTLERREIILSPFLNPLVSAFCVCSDGENMPGLRADVDPEGLLEYSVVYTDRALNHMSQSFQGVMKDIASLLKKAYNADAAIVVARELLGRTERLATEDLSLLKVDHDAGQGRTHVAQHLVCGERT